LLQIYTNTDHCLITFSSWISPTSAISTDAISFHYALPYDQKEFERILYHCKLKNVTAKTGKKKIRKRKRGKVKGRRN
jgi:hypothetical protein